MTNPNPNPIRCHHVALQTDDLANSVAWYQDFFGGRATWSTDRVSELTTSRLPGITRITEVAVGGLNFHLFERDRRDDQPLPVSRIEFQHVCLAVGSPAELTGWRDRWQRLYDSGRYRFARPDEPSAIVVDDQDVRSFYCLDVNGLEFEFTHVPGDRP
ncbi:VOC family protein [Streptomyces sp. SID685]|nr:VOC family protein [Streptomyces sp. SID685]MYR83404.1 VOC family protein [Streptomyces sp. SID685]